MSVTIDFSGGGPRRNHISSTSSCIPMHPLDGHLTNPDDNIPQTFQGSRDDGAVISMAVLGVREATLSPPLDGLSFARRDSFPQSEGQINKIQGPANVWRLSSNQTGCHILDVVHDQVLPPGCGSRMAHCQSGPQTPPFESHSEREHSGVSESRKNGRIHEAGGKATVMTDHMISPPSSGGEFEALSHSSSDRDILEELYPEFTEMPSSVVMYDCPREQLLYRPSLDGDKDGIFVPYGVADLCAVRPPVIDVYKILGGTPTYLDVSPTGQVSLVCQDIGRRSVVNTSDLYQFPWSSYHAVDFQVLAETARRIISEFCHYVGSGRIKLLSRQQLDRGNGVYFDTPIHFNDPNVLAKLGFPVSPFFEDASILWRRKSNITTQAPSGKVGYVVYPPFWPSHPIYPSRIDVPIAWDVCPESDPCDQPAADVAVLLTTTPGGIRVFAYELDLRDPTFAAFWIDSSSVDLHPSYKARRYYVLGRDSRSCLLSTHDLKYMTASPRAEYDCKTFACRVPRVGDEYFAIMTACRYEGKDWQRFKVDKLHLGKWYLRNLLLQTWNVNFTTRGSCLFELVEHGVSEKGLDHGPVPTEWLSESRLAGEANPYASIGASEIGIKVVEGHAVAVGLKEGQLMSELKGGIGDTYG